MESSKEKMFQHHSTKFVDHSSKFVDDLKNVTGASPTLWASQASPVYISVDTNQAFPEMPQTVVIDNETMLIESGHSIDQNVIYVDNTPSSYHNSEKQQYDFQGKISVVESSHGVQNLFCGECSARLESPVEFFQHWVANHCQLKQPLPSGFSSPVHPGSEGGDQTSTAPPGSGNGTTLTMERCNRCNHIFVEGTQRYRNHLDTCEQTQMSEVYYEAETSPSSPPPTSLQSPPSSRKRVKLSHGHHHHKYVCGVCNVGVKTVTSFFLHWLESHQGLRDILQEVWQCHGCSGAKLFPDCVSLQDHATKEHANMIRVDQQILNCPIPNCAARLCSTSGSVEDILGLHLSLFHRQRRIDQQMTCHICSAINYNNKDAYEHFRNEHQATCLLCSCDIDREASRDHYLSYHRCEIIWNRDHSLQKVSRSPQVSRICTGAQSGPMRLANGAIAKTSISGSGGISGSGAGLSQSSKRDSSSSTTHSSKSAKMSPPPATLISGDSNEERGFKCSKCSQFFTNVKVLERHYLSNHEFRCKFCSAVMDKDVYGQHLRQHLASERRKTVPTSSATSTTPPGSSSDH